MKIKICGLKYEANIQAIATFQPDMMGFVFYPASGRCVAETLDPTFLRALPSSIQKVGVFVDEAFTLLVNTAKKYVLDVVQLHGNESAMYCKALQMEGYSVMKAIPMTDRFDQQRLLSYVDSVDYFLFDTATPGYGGSGKSFRHDVLAAYELEIPFLLSGGIGNNNLQEVLRFRHPRFWGIDANSKLEDRVGLKNNQQTQLFINTIRHATI